MLVFRFQNRFPIEVLPFLSISLSEGSIMINTWSESFQSYLLNQTYNDQTYNILAVFIYVYTLYIEIFQCVYTCVCFCVCMYLYVHAHTYHSIEYICYKEKHHFPFWGFSFLFWKGTFDLCENMNWILKLTQELCRSLFILC